MFRMTQKKRCDKQLEIAVARVIIRRLSSKCDGREQAALFLFECIEAFYDRLRIRSTPDWLSRAEFEGKHAQMPLEGGIEPVNENGRIQIHLGKKRYPSEGVSRGDTASVTRGGIVVVRGCCPMKRGPRRGGRRGRKKEKGPFCYAEARAFFEARYPLTTLNARASPDCTCIG